MPVRQAVFSDLDSAVEASLDIMHARRQPGAHVRGNRLSNTFVSGTLRAHGGQAIVASTSQREIYSHEYQEYVHPQDRDYLSTRDPTGRLIIQEVPRDTWFMPPRTPSEVVNRFLADMWRAGFPLSATSADTEQRRHGGAMLYVVTSGSRPYSPLSPTEQFRGWATISPKDVNFSATTNVSPNKTNYHNHDVQELVLNSTTLETAQGDLKIEAPRIHGSRLVAVNEDEQSGKSWLSAAPLLTTAHDPLWDFRDIIVAHRNAAIQGRPIVLEVDTESEYSTHVPPEHEGDSDEDPIEQFEEELEEFRGFEREAFSPIEGMIFKRLDAVDLPDPTQALQFLAGRLSNAAPELPVNKLVPTSESSRQTDGDIEDIYFANIERRQKRFAWHIYKHVLSIGKRLGLVPSETVMPLWDVEWPDPRSYNARKKAFVDGKKAQTLKDAKQAGFLPKDPILREFQDDDKEIDPERVPPSVTMTKELAPEAPQEDEDASGSSPPSEEEDARGPMHVGPDTLSRLRNEMQRMVDDSIEDREMMEDL